MFIKEQWVAWGKDNLFWLLSEYRLTSVIVRWGVAILGHASGRIPLSVGWCQNFLARALWWQPHQN
jgi:hypothetical protein